MKSDGTRRAIIIAVLCLFSIAMLFMTASAWGLKAFARFAEFMTGDRIFLRILAGIGFGGLSAAGVFALVCTAKIGRIGNSKSSLNMRPISAAVRLTALFKTASKKLLQ